MTKDPSFASPMSGSIRFAKLSTRASLSPPLVIHTSVNITRDSVANAARTPLFCTTLGRSNKHICQRPLIVDCPLDAPDGADDAEGDASSEREPQMGKSLTSSVDGRMKVGAPS